MRAFFAVALLGALPMAQAQIYSCIDASGKRLTSDRPIVECNNKEQRVLNSDGSLREVLPPPMTADERAEAEAREAQRNADRVAQQDAIRRDRNLLSRFPNEGAHSRARAAALDDVRKSIEQSNKRLADLAVERKPLLDEAEFYKGRQMPLKLKQQLDLNDASTAAQRALIANQESETARISGLFDVELDRLRKLWAGAPAGSLGAIASPNGAASDAKAQRKPSRKDS